MAYLFEEKEYDNYVKFIEENILGLIYEYQGMQLVERLLLLISEKFSNFFLIIDNVKIMDQIEIINDFLNEYHGNNINISVFIQINKYTLNYICNNKGQFITNNIKNDSILNDFEHYLNIKNDYNYIDTLKLYYSVKLSPFFKNINIENYSFLLRLKYLISNSKNINYLKLTNINNVIMTFLKYKSLIKFRK